MKSFLRFLSSYVVATTTIACICANHCAIFYVYIGDIDKSSGVMTVSAPEQTASVLMLMSDILSQFFLPGVLRDDD